MDDEQFTRPFRIVGAELTEAARWVGKRICYSQSPSKTFTFGLSGEEDQEKKSVIWMPEWMGIIEKM